MIFRKLCKEGATVFSLVSVPVRVVALLIAGSLLDLSVAAETVVRCDSHGSRKVCPADTRGGVSLRYQYSADGCWQNDTWGHDAKGIWVANGCQADFTVGAPPPPKPAAKTNSDDKSGDALAGLLIGALAGAAITAAVTSNNNNNNDNNNWDGGDDFDHYQRRVRCNSDDMGPHQCSVGRIRYAELARQISGSPCIYGQTWGYHRDFIWVDRGCRADFWVR
jgi:Protein of unknown function (DUF3011)